LRQRVSCLVREMLSFSKKLAYHIGALKYFICHYNLAKAAALPVQHYPSAMYLLAVNVLLVGPNGQVAHGAIKGSGLVSCSVSN
jgi:hypothetical protein